VWLAPWILLAASAEARAFCQARTCGAMASSCAVDEHQCVTDGYPTAWTATAIPVWVDRAGSVRRGISAGATEAVLGRVFAKWMAADCPSGGRPRVSLFLARAAPATDASVTSVVSYVDDAWPYGSGIGALTTLQLNLDTGEILGGEVEINSDDHPFAVEAATHETDLEAVLTHEIGHLLGLDHSDVPDATMRPEAQDFAAHELSTLAPDDAAAVCFVYPPAVEQPEGVPDEGSGTGDATGCSVEPRGVALERTTYRMPSQLFAFLAVGVFAGLRRSRRRSGFEASAPARAAISCQRYCGR
jgi:hypothetical protein